MFGIRKKQSKAPDGFVIGLPISNEIAEQGGERTGMLVGPKRRGSLIVYFDKGKGWRWRLVAPNGKVTADSGESYIHRYDAKVAAQRLSEVAASARLEVRDR